MEQSKSEFFSCRFINCDSPDDAQESNYIHVSMKACRKAAGM
jgi:hypothetical protein